MKAEILATGDEIRSGALVDSNSAYISQKLEETGISVVRHSCVGDDSDILTAILREIGGRTDICVVTGGLGPTSDDLTSETAAKAAGVELILNKKALSSVEEFFKTRKRLFTSSNKKQALLPEGSDCLFNPIGSAPGFSLKIDRCLFFFLPGVPPEMRKMLSDKVLPHIEKLQGKIRAYCQNRTISTFGLTEAAVNEKLTGFPDLFKELKLGLRANFPVIQVKLYGSGEDENNLNELLDKAADWISQKIGKRIVSSNGSSMEKVVGDLLIGKKATIAVAESCTGGLISHLFTNVPGSSDFFLFSGVTYSNKSKIKILGVSPSTLKKYGAVHEETAKEMAKGAKRITGATCGLSTTGIAGPDGGTESKPVGTVCIGLATPDAVYAHRFHFSSFNRLMNKKIFAITALDLLRRELLDLSK
ncbi:MAG: competence/damage-inducible protein A [Desulfobacterales bacterium]|nr:competence/damage-inducible protein A [Desulfobacterales bacterium]MDX2508540.1 competence/damage-inducible protein A [Desulfobacterales bacterium]